jgi:tricarballylate dehydrogenase
MVNKAGERFCDEGENEISLIYSKIGAAIAEQPDAKAYQIFDKKVEHLISEKYRTHSKAITADTLEALAERIGVNPESFVSTVQSFNAATRSDQRFDPYTLDSLSTKDGYSPRKSNWAQPVHSPPYTAYAVTVGITFTFGGIKSNTSGQVLNNEGNVMPGLYAMGEMTGGFYFGYAAGASLIRSAVMGRIAGKHAAANRQPDTTQYNAKL